MSFFSRSCCMQYERLSEFRATAELDCFLRFYRAEFPVLYDKFMACVGCMNTQIYRPKCLVPFIGCDNLSNTVDKSICNVVLVYHVTIYIYVYFCAPHYLRRLYQ